MHSQTRGIVLFQEKKKVSLLDQRWGRITATSFSSLLIGGLYTYDLDAQARQYLMKGEEILFLPFDIIREDFLFLHHLFEISLLFAPVGSCVQGIFDMFTWIYEQPAAWFSNKHKKFVVFKLLASLGLWPLGEHSNQRLLQIASFPIDRIDREILELLSEKELAEWLQRSFLCHPYAQNMKTKLFLESVPYYD